MVDLDGDFGEAGAVDRQNFRTRVILHRHVVIDYLRYPAQTWIEVHHTTNLIINIQHVCMGHVHETDSTCAGLALVSSADTIPPGMVQ